MSDSAITFKTAAVDDRSVRNVVLCICDGDASEVARDHLARYLGPEATDRIVDLLEKRQVRGKYKEFNLIRGDGSGRGLDWILLMGLGKRKVLQDPVRRDDRIRSVMAIAARHFRRKNIGELAVEDFADFGVGPEDAGQLVVEGMVLGLYRFDRYKTEASRKYPKDQRIREVTILTDGDRSVLETSIARGEICAESTCLARDLVNTPAADLTPQAFAHIASEVARSIPGVSVEVMDRAAMERANMGLHLAVARGSDNDPCVVIVKHQPRKDGTWDLVLVGKGVTFDAGGYDLKPSPYMERMYGDMAGAAAVLAALRSIGLMNLPVNVVGIMPLAENLVSGRAYKPGDILTSHKGLTVEITNTDAEGRLLLADALSLASSRFRPRFIVDVATLTGAIVTALGQFVTGLFTYAAEPDVNDAFAERVSSAGRMTGEWVWRLPVDDDYKVQLASDVADLENCDTDRAAGAGSITAALFLKEFVDFDVVEAWAHLDIAGTSMMKRRLIYNKCPYQPKEGATGVGARLLTRMAVDLANGTSS